MKYYLAIDIGASSGKGFIGYLDGDVLKIEEVYRFYNGLKEIDGVLSWDVNYLFKEVKNTIKKALSIYKNIESMSIDTWAIDYCLLNDNKLIEPVYSYRDKNVKKYVDEVHGIINFNKLYEITGSQFQEFNTIYQLYRDKKLGRLNTATSYLMIPEYLMYLLTGVKKREFTNLGSTGLCDKNTFKESDYIIEKLGFNKELFIDSCKPGDIVGYFKKEIIEEVNGNIKVVLCPTHDTASAVDSIKLDMNTPYISSGTWSLLGIKTKKPITNKIAMEANYSNEYGPNYVRFQKNIMGLWIVECVKKEINIDFSEMIKIAKESDYKEIFDCNENRFLSPKIMVDEIKNYFKEKNIEPPKTNGDLMNSIFHSLAYSYKVAIDELEKITNEKYKELYIFGGGAKNDYLNSLAQKYTGLNVKALKIEATAIGNLKSQIGKEL